jgi:hypothetical protein
MKSLHRITTEYDPAEDRIRLTNNTGQEEASVLWLTQRLLNRLVPHLCQRLEKETQYRQGEETSLRAQLEQSFAQQRAQAALPGVEPVQAAANMPPWRVEAVDMKFEAGGVRLTFRGVLEADRAVLQLPVLGLRQWLDILHRQYRRAGWPALVWPVWMEEAGATPLQTAPAGALH